jgi:hypothetical protein
MILSEKQQEQKAKIAKMGKYKKISLWLMGTAGVLLVLLFAFLLLLPKLINLEPIKAKVLASLSEKVGGEVEYQRFDLSFLPRPHVVIHQVSLSVAGKTSGTLESVRIYPKILPLITARLQLAKLQAEAPDFKMSLPRRTEKRNDTQKPLSFASIEGKVASLLVPLALNAPGLVVEMKKGRLDFTQENETPFSFRDIHGRIAFPPSGIMVHVTCSSNLWESISVAGDFDSKNINAKGHIDLKHLKPQTLTDYLFPNAPLRVGESIVDLGLDFRTDGLSVLQAEIKGLIPYLTLVQGNKKLVVKGKSLEGAFQMNQDQITASLTELDLDYPQLTMTGKLLMDLWSVQISVELEGREVDIDSTREAALAIAGDIPVTQEIFSLVKGGKLPLIIFKTRGVSVADLGKVENIVIMGSMREGKILVPNTDLDLEDVKGEVEISKGMLKGENLEARLGNSWGHEGTLKLGVMGETAPFHLDMMVQADLAQLPPLLKRWIENKDFAKELNLIEHLEGNAKGRLVLGESTASIKPHVDLAEFSLTARHQRIPYPLAISGGHFSYEQSRIKVENLSGKLVRSSFSELSVLVDWEKEPYLKVESGKFGLFLGDIYPWLSSLEKLSGPLKSVKAMEGAVNLSALNLKGPLLRPEDWSFQTTGELKNLAVHTTLLPGPIELTSGRFRAIPEELSFTDTHTKMLDASLGVSGILTGYLKGLHKTNLSLKGKIGPEADQWLSDFIKLPPKLTVRAPLSISHASLLWERGGKISLAGDFAVQSGPRVSADIVRDPEELLINRLLIKDNESHASCALNLKKRAFSLRFTGNLTKTTLDALLVKNEFLTGWVRGDFQAQILLDEPMRSTAQGRLIGEDLIIPWKLKVPVKIDRISLHAIENDLTVESAIFALGDTRMALEGNLEFSPDGPLLDMDLSAHEIEWENIGKILGEDGKKGDLKQAKSSWDLPVQGIVRFKTQRFTYDQFTLRPLHADVSFTHNEVSVSVSEANLCGISFPGLLKVTPQELLLDFKPASKNKELDPLLTCFANKRGLMTGNFNLNGEVKARGKFEEVAKVLKGNLECTANDGRIYRFRLLAKIFALLNITEIFRGHLPDLTKEGLAYNYITVKSDLENGKLLLREVHIDGSSMEIACTGDIDLIDKKLDLTVLLAPLKTLDRIVKKIPLIRTITAGTLVSIPVKVRGDLTNPKITPLAASAVGSELLGIMKRTLKLPIKVIQPVLPEEKEDAPQE